MIDPNFKYFDGVTAGELPQLFALSEAKTGAKRHRLVKAAKSPTAEELRKKAQFFSFQAEIMNNHKKSLIDTTPPKAGDYRGAVVSVIPEPQIPITKVGTPGAYTVIQYREWSEEWRIRTRAETLLAMTPPEQAGDRKTAMLTERGARKIADSCFYVSEDRGGFTTFCTNTFSTEVREKIASGEVTIQKEVSRMMDGLQKMYQRGWTDSKGRKVEGSSDKLDYIWVVEVPKNEDGEDNPHVHVLMRWRVPYWQFEDWSTRIEGIWGQGFAHLEKIKDPECAGAYMAKAAGYLCKANGQSDQGIVTGNRYGISTTARAPDWVMVGEHHMHIMGRMIADIHDHMSEKYGRLYKQRRVLNDSLNQMKEKKIHNRRRQYVGKALQAVRTKIKEIPARCNKYQIILKGKDTFADFMAWARSSGHWRADIVDWLPEKNGFAWDMHGTSEPDTKARPFNRAGAEFRKSQLWRRHWSKLKAWAGRTWGDMEWDQVRCGEYLQFAAISDYQSEQRELAVLEYCQ